MSQTTPVSVESIDAPHPFNQPSADLILRTADQVDFRVHTQILAQASPFFATMLALPQPHANTISAPDSSAETEGTPVVPVSEDSTTLELLLRLVYPILKTHSEIEDPQVMGPALLAATKYEMDLPVQMMSERLVVITPKSPLQVWAAACRTGLESVARRAAEALKAIWTRQANTEALALMDGLGDMAGISAGDYYRLKQFLMGRACSTLLSPPTREAGGVATTPISPFSTDIPGTDLKCRTPRRGLTAPFLAHQSVLSSQSSWLKAQILGLRSTIPPDVSSSANIAGPLVLEFDDEPEVISMLLTACYCDDEALPTDLTYLAKLLVVSRKYGMARVARSSIRAWDETATPRPLEAYFIALAHGLVDFATAAARNVLAEPITDAYVAVMDTAPALAYHRLLVYYDACSTIFRQRLVQASSQIPMHVIQTYTCDDPTSAAVHIGSLYKMGRTHCQSRVNVPATDIVLPLKNIANTAHLSPGANLRNTFRDAVVRAGSGRSQSTDLPSFAAMLIQCVISLPDDLDKALDDVEIILG
ncbi:uncharacterized protein TRAVEDRAFT_47724 [Trametes versicolor FP-101664 SS1]|uniref:uncharacterized protein n=1 Tax=Trametes versicolor (strain FP-101664) TaxID=717944 RepID=UPI000462256D|nr:uncharacterized protein TRAVEDRAFT_47724 [Trametes versicolor FP-101664 SS1]EIW58582.1 hypothetical protein TRAVEDRAFT_47724 [Trametes versicolor FP-101664 SS1]